MLSAVKNNKHISFGSLDSSYAIFGTNCHTFYHAVGDFVAMNSNGKSLTEMTKDAPNDCTSGFIMGLYKRTALINNFSTDLLADFYKSCPVGSEHQCAHEIGHNLHDKYGVSILKILDKITSKQYKISLPSYNYISFEKPDLNAPFDDCRKLVPEDELPYCYTGVGHNLFLFSEFSPDGYKSLFKECDDKTTPSNKPYCYDFLVYRIGINDVATKYIKGNFTEGNKICNDIVNYTNNKDLKRHCYLGVGGGIGLFVDSEYSNKTINGDNLATIQKAVLDFINLCENADKDYIEDCYKGLLGTKIKKLYKQLNLESLIIEEILPKIQNDFEVVG